MPALRRTVWFDCAMLGLGLNNDCPCSYTSRLLILHLRPMSSPLALHHGSRPEAIDALLRGDAWFRSCSPALQAALIAHGHERRLRPGEPLFGQGETDGNLYLLIEGALAVQSVDAGGEQSMLVMLEPFHWFGELSFTDGLPRSHDAIAHRDCRVWCVGRAGMRAELQARPEGWFHIACLMSAKTRLLLAAVDADLRGPLAMRVARRIGLAMLASGRRAPIAPGDDAQGRDAPGQGQVRMSQEQIARMLGASRGSVNRALHDLQDTGVIRLGYGLVEVLDVGQLFVVGRLPRQD
jgi:CRP/FNR family transcriptional regulator, cyclic AMP receptor protein